VQEQKFQPPIFGALVVFQHDGGLTDADHQKIDALKAALVDPNKTSTDPIRSKLATVIPDGVVVKPAPNSPDAEMVFMRGHWNACPAHAFVTGLLLAVWRRSLQEAVVA